MSVSLAGYALLLALGALISYEDWRTRKIRNLWIAAGLAGAAAGYGWLLANSLLGAWKARWLGLGEYYLPLSFYPLAAANAALALTAGLWTWRLGMWPAGDAKLYIVCALLAGLVDPNLPGFPLLLFLKLLVNTFVPAGLWVLAAVLWGSARALSRAQPGALRREAVALAERAWIRLEDLWPYRLGVSVYLLNVFLLFLGLQLLEKRFAALSFLRGGIGQLLVLLSVYLAWSPLSRLFAGRKFWRGWLALLSWWMLDPVLRAADPSRVLADGLRTMLLFGLLLAALKAWVVFFLRRESELRLRGDELAPGMILSDEAWDAVSEAAAGAAPARYADGLFPEDVERLRAAPGLSALALSVYRATPFAVWVFLGSLLTLSLRRNVVHWLFSAAYDPRAALWHAQRAWGLVP